MNAHASAQLPLCTNCDAVCCRLIVVLQPEDRIPAHLTACTPAGLTVMARDEEGWCVAVDAARMRCSIYETRPGVCRRFAMSGPYCHAVRDDYLDRTARGIRLRCTDWRALLPITPNYAFEKRQRELAKKRKQEEKKVSKRDTQAPAPAESAQGSESTAGAPPAPPAEQAAPAPRIHRKRGP